jgi:hypothetical protein
MSDPIGGYLAIGRDRDPTLPWRAGDVVDLYPVLEEVGEFIAQARDLRASPQTDEITLIDNSEAAARTNAVILARMQPPPRVQSQHGCDCSKKGRHVPLVKQYALDAGIWIWIRGNRIPNPQKGETAHLHEADSAWPMKSVKLLARATCCRVCHSYWGVHISEAGYQLVRLGRPSFSVRVAE